MSSSQSPLSARVLPDRDPGLARVPIPRPVLRGLPARTDHRALPVLQARRGLRGLREPTDSPAPPVPWDLRGTATDRPALRDQQALRVKTALKAL